jgi:Domain of unknown function (DUF4189)
MAAIGAAKVYEGFLRMRAFALTIGAVSLLLPVQSPSYGAGNSKPYHAAIATHPDVLEIWMFGGFSGPDAERLAGRKVLEACTRAMGSGCMFAVFQNEHIILSRNAAGVAKLSQKPTEQLAMAEARSGCNERRELPCEILASFSARTKQHSPDISKNRSTNGAAAWVKIRKGETDSRVWIATGYANGSDAQTAALAACQTQSGGRECETVTNVRNGVLLPYRGGKHHVGVAVESTASRAKDAIKLSCKLEFQRECQAQTSYSSRIKGSFLHDFATGRAL